MMRQSKAENDPIPTNKELDMIDFENAKANRTKTTPKGFTPQTKSDRPTTKAELCSILNISVEAFEAHCQELSLKVEDRYTQVQVDYWRDRLGATARAGENIANKNAPFQGWSGAFCYFCKSFVAIDYSSPFNCPACSACSIAFLISLRTKFEAGRSSSFESASSFRFVSLSK
jgi:hypothetical protein